MNEIIFWIPGNTPSSKNSKIKSKNGIFASKTVKKYLRALGLQAYSPTRKTLTKYKTIPCVLDESFPTVKENVQELLKTKEYPVVVEFHFVRQTKRAFDFNNITQIVQDIMVAADLIEDDDMNHLIPIPWKLKGKYFTVNKRCPGVLIRIT